MLYSDRIRLKLTEGLEPSSLEIVDDSARHAGHAGHDPQGETHFNVTIVSEHFVGKTRVERQRLVYGLLASELSERVHALALKTLTPTEAGRDT